MKPWQRQTRQLPPKQDAASVVAMEDVLDAYERPYVPPRPVVCLDEGSKQLVGEVQDPLPPAPGSVARPDAEYVRNGTADLFRVAEPPAGCRRVTVTDTPTRADFARPVRDLTDGRYWCAEKVVRVMDNLNTHAIASLYEAFDPAEAKWTADRLEVHHTPEHGSRRTSPNAS